MAYLFSQDGLNCELNQWLKAVRREVSGFLRSPGARHQLTRIFPSATVDMAHTAELLEDWADETFSQFPQIGFIAALDIAPAVGVFVRDTDRIYLSREWFASPTVASALKIRVILEEVGHWLDAHISPDETQGDEGAHFAAVVMGDELSDEDITQFRNEDDRAYMMIDGALLRVECATFDANEVASIRDGFTQSLQKINDATNSKAVNQPMPLFGGTGLQVYNSAVTGLGILGQYSTQINAAISALLGNPGSGPNGTFTENDIANAINGAIGGPQLGATPVTWDAVNNEWVFNATANFLQHQQTLSTSQGLGLNGLVRLNSAGVAQVGVSYTFNMSMGFDGDFYVRTTKVGTPEITLGLNIATTPDTKNANPNLSVGAEISLGGLQVFEADVMNTTGLNVQFGLNLSDSPSDGDDKLRVTELLNDYSFMTPSATGALNLDIALDTASWYGGILAAHTELGVDWTFSYDQAKGFMGTSPVITLSNTNIDVFSYFTDVVKPFLDKIKFVLDPVSQVMDVLKADIEFLHDIPGVNLDFLDVLDADFQPVTSPDKRDGVISLLDLAYSKAKKSDFDTVRPFLLAIDEITTWYNILNGLGSFANRMALGDFKLTSDIRDGAFTLDALNGAVSTGMADLQTYLQSQGATSLSQLAGMAPGAQSSVLMPLLTNAQTSLAYLFGGNVDILKLDMPKLALAFGGAVDEDGKFLGDLKDLFKLPIFPGLDVVLEGGLRAIADIDFGYDTSGLKDFLQSKNATDLLNGFYVTDWDSQGKERPELVLGAQLNFGLEAGIQGLISAFAGGAIEGIINLDLIDTGLPDDGKVHLDEFASSNPLQMFEGKGLITASLVAYAQFLWITRQYRSPEITLAEFNFGNLTGDTTNPGLGSIDKNGSLILHMGDYAKFRLIPDTFDTAETFKVNSISAGKFGVSAFNYSQTFQDPTSIYVRAGQGDDVLLVEADVSIALDIEGGNGSDVLNGGAKNDLILGDDSGNVFFGNDFLAGEEGDDTLVGGDGNDLLDGGAGADSMDGGNGVDVVNYLGSNATIHISVSGNLLVGVGGHAQGDMLRGIEHIVGTDIETGGDSIIDSNSFNVDNVFSGLKGNDNLFGGGGNDTLVGGEGNDVLEGGTGADVLSGGLGDDIYAVDSYDDVVDDDLIDAGGGRDKIVALLDYSIASNLDIEDLELRLTARIGEGNSLDNIIVGTGFAETAPGDYSDDLRGLGGNDTLLGGRGNDLLAGGTGNDALSGETGNDTLYGGDDRDLLLGEAGNDLLFGESGNDRLEGGDNNDTLSGGANDDLLRGEGDQDALLGDAGNDTLQGGAQNDTLSGGDDDDLLQGEDDRDGLSGDAGNDTLQGGAQNDTLSGGSGNDLLDGGDHNDILAGGTGNDELLGQNNDDTLDGEGGADTMRGGTGNDTYYVDDANDVIDEQVGAGTERVLVSANYALTAGAEIEQILTTNAAATTPLVIRGNEFAQTITGNAGDNILEGMGGPDTLNGGTGNDVASYEHSSQAILLDFTTNTRSGDAVGDVYNSIEGFYGSAGFNDTLIGSGASNRFNGLGGDDLVQGLAGNDFLYGGSGNDSIEGGLNNDWLYGGQGSDTLTGDTGNDTMVGEEGGDLYYVDTLLDSVFDNALGTGGGVDRIIASLSYSLAAAVERADIEELELRNKAISGTGNGLNNLIIANEQDNILDGLSGADTMVGGAGNDTFFVDDPGDRVTEDVDSGHDVIKLATGNFVPGYDYDIAAPWAVNIEDLIVIDNAVDIDLFGNALDNYISDNTKNNGIDARGGNDVVRLSGGLDSAAMGLGGTADDDHLIIDWSLTTGDVTGGYVSYQNAFGDGDTYGTFSNSEAGYAAGFSGVERFTITTGSGNDTFTTGIFNDVITLGAGNDHVNTRTGKATVHGGTGNDRWQADISAETVDITLNLNNATLAQDIGGGSFIQSIEMLSLTTGSGNDRITTLKAIFDDTVTTGAGNDVVFIGGGIDGVGMGLGATDDDLLIIDWSASTGDVYGGYVSYENAFGEGDTYGTFSNSKTGYQAAYSGVDRYNVTTGSGNDSFTTGIFNDVISLNGGNDYVNTRFGKATVHGGAGNDRWEADLAAETPDITLNLNNATLSQDIGGGNFIESIEMLSLTVGSGNDKLTTLTAIFDDAVATGLGNDIVFLGGGFDFASMGRGGATDDDLLVIDWSATKGNVTGGYTSYEDAFENGDTYGTFSNTQAGYQVDFFGVERFTVTTGSGNDSITTGIFNDVVSLAGGNDYVNTRFGKATVHGGAGNDRWEADLGAETVDIVLNLNNATLSKDIGGGNFIESIEVLSLTVGSGNDQLTTLKAIFDDAVATGHGNDIVFLGGGFDFASMGRGGAADDDLLVIDWSATTGNVTGGYSSYQDAFENGDTYGTFSNKQAGYQVDFFGVERFNVTTGSGNDVFTTGIFNDVISLGAGNDHVNTRTGKATVHGGAGNDRWEADISAETVDITLNLDNATLAQDIGGGSFIQSIEMLSLTTGSGNDVITTLKAIFDDGISTGGGNDIVFLAGGLDSVAMGRGGSKDDDHLIIDWSLTTGNVTGGYVSYHDAFGDGDTYGAFGSSQAGYSAGFEGVERFTVTTGSGNDAITTGIFGDIVSLGAGNDYVNTRFGKATVHGGTGNDRWEADLGAETADITLNLNNATLSKDIGGGNFIENIEVLSLTVGSGNDKLTTLTAIFDDAVATGLGNDVVFLGGGVDFASMGRGGATDDDLLVIDWSATTGNVTGGYTSYDDAFENGDTYGRFSNSQAGYQVDFNGVERFNVTTGSGNDAITTGIFNDVISLGDGDDYVNTRFGKASVHGGAGNDRWDADLGGETASISLNLNNAVLSQDIGGGNFVEGIEVLGLTVGSGNDVITTLKAIFVDGVATGAGNDTVYVGGGADSVDMGRQGAADDDLLIVDWSLTTGNVSGGYVSYHNGFGDNDAYGGISSSEAGYSIGFSAVERFNITTGSGNDSIVTHLGNDTVSLGSGNDTVSTSEGDDRISLVGDGTDSVSAGGGTNTLRVDFSAATAAVTMTAASIAAGAYGAVTYSNIRHFDLLLSEFDEAITTGSGNDTITGGEGNDSLDASIGNDQVAGDEGHDTLTGGRGNDTVYGGVGNDVIYGDFISPFDGTGAYLRNSAENNYTRDDAIDLTKVFKVLGAADPEIEGSGTLPTASVTVDGSAVGGYHWYTFSVGATGGTVIVDIDRGSENGVNPGFDTYLRIYDSQGNLVTGDDDSAGDAGSTGGNSRAQFTGLAGERYFAKVSRYSDSGIATTADYNLHVTVPSVGSALPDAAGNDVLYGGEGNDIFYADEGDDYYDGGDGFDIVSYENFKTAITVDLSISGPQNTGAAGIDTLVNIEYIIGTSFGDVFNGDGDNNHLIAGLGNDTLNGFGGNDTLDGGADNDVMNGGAGNDTFIVDSVGDKVNDSAGQGTQDRVLTSVSYVLAAGAEIEELVSTAGNASITLTGNEFGNLIVAGGGNDTMTGNAGNDTFVDGGGNDVMDGGLDADTVNYSAAGSRVVVSLSLTTAQNTGGGGTDTILAVEHIIGSTFNDILNGTAANNVFDGGDGQDALNGLSGNDALTGGLGNDTLDGGDGNDVLAGGDGNDSINGGNNNDNITGGLGNDTIVGGSGNETVDGGAGRDRMTGGLGNDFYTVDDSGDVVIEAFNEGTDSVNTTLGSLVLAANVERLVYIGTGAFVGIGNIGDNRLNGNAGDDRFVDVAGGNDTVSGGAGSDSMDFRGSSSGVVLNFVTGMHGGAAAGDLYGSMEKYFGSNTADDIMTGGGAGRFVFAGFGGNDTLTGAGNIDQLQGQAGNDSLSGLGGVDSLDGGAGNDTLSGGAAKDYFVYSAAGFGKDVITDFQDGVDKLKVHSSIANNIAAFGITGNGTTQVVLTQISNTANTITINGATAINITALDFQFY